MANSLHNAGIIENQQMKDFDDLGDEEEIENFFYEASKKFSWDKYEPKFTPQDYLRFLKEMDNHIFIKKHNDDKYSIELWTMLWNDETTIERRVEGRSLEECLEKVMSEKKYQARYELQDYLRFMNEYPELIFWKNANKTENRLKFLYNSEEGRVENQARGRCIEECLDQAILATGFYKELEKK
jgi:hypothetical protein